MSQLDVGVDIGERRLAVSVSTTEVYVTKVRSSTLSDELHWLADWAREFIPPQATVWAERPFTGGNGARIQSSHRLAMTLAAVITAHPGQSFLVVPATWKAVVVGHGGADKRAIADWLDATDPAAATACRGNQDAIDATCLRFYGEYRRALGLADESGLQRDGDADLLRV